MVQTLYLFGAPHLAVIALTLLMPLGLILLARRDRRIDPWARWFFAALLAGGWVCWYILFALRGWLSLGNGLPLNLCDWAAAALIMTLLRPNQFTYDLGYFMGLCGTMHGLITPPVHHGFPDAEFIFSSSIMAGLSPPCCT